MLKVLVAHRSQKIRDWIVTTIRPDGYEIIDARDGNVALTQSLQEGPDLILIDAEMPGVDGFEVLSKLKNDSTTSATPVILTTGSPSPKGESNALRLGAVHYIAVPCPPNLLRSAIKLSVRETGIKTEDGTNGSGSIIPRELSIITTGNEALDELLGGGIPLESLSLVKGTTTGTNSALCEQLAFASLQSDLGVTYFTSGHTPSGLVKHMASVGRDVSEYVSKKKLRVHHIDQPTPEGSDDRCEDPERLLILLGVHVEGVSGESKVTIVDSMVELASQARARILKNFFSSCWRLCNVKNGTIIVSIPSSPRLERVAEEELIARKTLGASLSGATSTFEVQPGVGLVIYPAGNAAA